VPPRQFTADPGAESGGVRTVGQLRDAARERREGRSRLAAKERERQQAKAQREAAVARQHRLDDLAREGDRAWQRVIALVEAKKVREYDAAVVLLCDLRDLSDRDGHRATFTARLRELRQRYGNRPALLERLDRANPKAVWRSSQIGLTMNTYAHVLPEVERSAVDEAARRLLDDPQRPWLYECPYRR
jgi:hypothetical protein